MLKKTLVLCIACTAFLTGETPSIGTVNFKKCVEDSKMGKKEIENFETLKKQLEGQFEEREKYLDALSKKLDDPDYLDSLSPEKEAELKHEFRAQTQELAQRQSQFYQMLSQANHQILQKLGDQVATTAKKVADEMRLKIIINEELTFYSDPSLDITERVIEQMDADFQP